MIAPRRWLTSGVFLLNAALNRSMRDFMPDSHNFPQIFERLRAVLAEYQDIAVITADDASHYSLDIGYALRFKKRLLFGAVQVNKNYVSYHLMPVYMYPDLLNDISPERKKRMQGKSCFNFKKLDEALFRELGRLTYRSVERLKVEGIVSQE